MRFDFFDYSAIATCLFVENDRLEANSLKEASHSFFRCFVVAMHHEDLACRRWFSFRDAGELLCSGLIFHIVDEITTEGRKYLRNHALQLWGYLSAAIVESMGKVPRSFRIVRKPMGEGYSYTHLFAWIGWPVQFGAADHAALGGLTCFYPSLKINKF